MIHSDRFDVEFRPGDAFARSALQKRLSLDVEPERVAAVNSSPKDLTNLRRRPLQEFAIASGNVGEAHDAQLKAVLVMNFDLEAIDHFILLERFDRELANRSASV
jgi:hypothetical protein